MVRRMAAAVKQLDTTRPVTAAQSGGMLNPVNASQAADVVGLQLPAGSTTLSTPPTPTRPIYQFRGHLRLHDARRIRQRPQGRHSRLLRRPAPGPGARPTATPGRQSPRGPSSPAASSGPASITAANPSRSSGPPPARPSAAWTCAASRRPPSTSTRRTGSRTGPSCTSFPHWNWPARRASRSRSWRMTNADTVALSLNGKSLGEKPVDKYQMATWDVPYAARQAGSRREKGGGKESRASPSKPPARRPRCSSSPTARRLAGDGWDAQPDHRRGGGRAGPRRADGELPVKFELSGPGAIIGLGNGDPNSHEPEKGNRRSLFNGLAQVIVQSGLAGRGKLTLRATSEGLAPAEVVIDVTAAPARPRRRSPSRRWWFRAGESHPFRASGPIPISSLAPTT